MFEKYENASGAKIHKMKTTALYISAHGKLRNRNSNK